LTDLNKQNKLLNSLTATKLSVQMSKITNDGDTRSVRGCCTHVAKVGVKGLKTHFVSSS